MSDVTPALPLLIRVSGRDRPSLTRDLLQLLGRAGAVLEDMEQLVVRERLTLDVRRGVVPYAVLLAWLAVILLGTRLRGIPPDGPPGRSGPEGDRETQPHRGPDRDRGRGARPA